MNNFLQIKNDLINNIDSKAGSRTLQKPLKNTLKSHAYVKSNIVYGTGTLYNQSIAFQIPRQFNDLAQMYIKANLSTGGVLSTVESYFATKIFKTIQLRTVSGTILQTITPQYSSMRIDELFETPLFTHLSVSIEPGDFTSDETVFVPLLMFFSESVTTFLKTRHLEPLELYCITNDNKESMGMSVDLTSMAFELQCMYFDSIEEKPNTDFLLTSKAEQEYLVGSYDVFNEDNLIIDSGATSARLLIRCPHPAFNISVSLVDVNTNRVQINTMTITAAGTELVKLNFKANYNLFSSQDAFLENGTLTYWFSKEKNRSTDSGLLTFGAPFFPCYIDLTFDALDNDYILYTFLEHRTNMRVDTKGFISYSDDRLNSVEYINPLQQLNSALAGETLLG